MIPRLRSSRGRKEDVGEADTYHDRNGNEEDDGDRKGGTGKRHRYSVGRRRGRR